MDLLIQQSIKSESPKALATLIRILGDFDLAEDVLQDALVKAVEKWQQDGIPNNPAAWLISTGRNRAIDLFRHNNLEVKYIRENIKSFNVYDKFVQENRQMEHSHFNDDLLRLIFTCCHPALSIEAQLALTLKTIVGFSMDEVARAFLVNERTLEQRLVRAKRKIKKAGIPYEVPDSNHLSERLDAVLGVIYLIFNEGYTASKGDNLIRQDLCNEAIRLVRLIHRLFRGESEVIGLLALLILQNARRGGRVTETGDLVQLEYQDRSLWNQAEISEGVVLTEKALIQKQPGPYQIQAAISTLHCQAKTFKETDWTQISLFYFELEKYLPTAVVRINRIIAVSMVKGVEYGISELESMISSPELSNYHLLYASIAELYLKNNQLQKALPNYQMALKITKNPVEIKHLQSQIDKISLKLDG